MHAETRKAARQALLMITGCPRLSRVGPFARDSERFVIRLLIGGIKKPR